jgi:hypothetical protein
MTACAEPSAAAIECLHGDVHADRCPARIHRPPTPPPPFRFLDLPGEIQNHIVNYFIVADQPLTIHQPRFNRHRSPPKPRSRPRFDRPVPPTPPLSRSASADSTKSRDAELGHTRLALMLTCRQLYREHWRTYYGKNVFEFNLDTFIAFLENIPTRCSTQIRRVKFRMPHRYHHGRIWNMLAGLKRLEELELQLCPTSRAESSEYDHAIGGARYCRRLLAFRLTRTPEDEDDKQPDQDDAVLVKDQQVEDQINTILREREMKRKQQSRSRSRPVRTALDGDFPANDSEV